MKRLWCLTLAAILGAAACDRRDSPGATAPGSGGKTVIAVIPKGTTHEFWKTVHAGAAKAAKEANVEIVWKGPIKEDDRDSQIQTVETFVSRGVQAIVLAPLDNVALVAPVEAAQQRNIPVVIFDSGLQTDNYVSFVATDNRKGGELGGHKLAELLGGKGKVILLRYEVGSASTEEREAGFLTAIAQHPGIEVVSSNQYGHATKESAMAASENLLNTVRGSSPGTLSIDGVFCPNESTTFGMLRALQDMGAAGKVKFVGFDGSSELLEGLENGQINALVLQNPMRMGYLAVKTIVQKLRGEPVEKRIDTGAAVVTKANMNDAQMKDLVHPDLSE